MQQPTIDALKQQIADDINRSLARHGFHLIYTPPTHSEPPVPNGSNPHSDARSDGSEHCSEAVTEQLEGQASNDEERFRSKLRQLLKTR